MCLAIPGEVVELREQHGLPYAKVRFGGITRDVCLSCQPDALVGDYVLVHVGLAIARLNRAEAERTYELLRQLGQTAEAEQADAMDPQSPTEPETKGSPP